MADMRAPAAEASSFMTYRNAFDLTGRCALVTGSGRGIGRAIATGLAAHGASVGVHFGAKGEMAEAAAATIRAQGGSAVVLGADLALAGQGRHLAQLALGAMGKIDILIANASVDIEEPLEAVSEASFDRQINVNLRSTLELMQALLPGMAERHWGRVVTIGSVQQTSPNPRKAVYAATKSAQANLVLSIARAYAAAGVTANNLAPGLIRTDRTAKIAEDAQFWRRKIDQIPVGRAGEPDDLVGATVLLCSEAGSYITAQDILIDGGLNLGGGRG